MRAATLLLLLVAAPAAAQTEPTDGWQPPPEETAPAPPQPADEPQPAPAPPTEETPPASPPIEAPEAPPAPAGAAIPAETREPAPSYELAAGAAYEVQTGKLNKLVTGYASPTVGASWYVNQGLLLGLEASYGFARIGNQCALAYPPSECSARDLRVAMVGRVRLGDARLAVPWVGASVGWEWLQIQETDIYGSAPRKMNGPRIALLGGVDIDASVVVIRPFLGFSIAALRGDWDNPLMSGIQIGIQAAFPL